MSKKALSSKRTFYRDRWNSDKILEVVKLVGGYYLRQYIKGVQFGRGLRTTRKHIASIGIFSFEELAGIEEA